MESRPWLTRNVENPANLIPVLVAADALRFAAGMFQDMARTRDAAACAREAGAARAAAATSRNPLLCLARAAWWAAVADRRVTSQVSGIDLAAAEPSH